MARRSWKDRNASIVVRVRVWKAASLDEAIGPRVFAVLLSSLRLCPVLVGAAGRSCDGRAASIARARSVTEEVDNAGLLLLDASDTISFARSLRPLPRGVFMQTSLSEVMWCQVQGPHLKLEA
jgi:hypothetical protein